MARDRTTDGMRRLGRRLTSSSWRFWRREDGASAIEFALVGLPFFMIIFAILETGMIYWADRVLQSHASAVARAERTGFTRQVDDKDDDGDPIKRAEDLCRDRIPGLMFDCSKMLVDVSETVNAGPLLDSSNNPIPDNFGRNAGESGKINIVRVYYPWEPLFVGGLVAGGRMTPDGKNMLYAASGFVTE